MQRPPPLGLFPYIIAEIAAAGISFSRRNYPIDTYYVFAILVK
jgi:hypothetical protein